jgi:sirohydrochlorin ferrochelatase
MTALIVFAHGSSVGAANDAIRDIAARLQQSAGFVTEAAFLEVAHPDLYESVAALVERGATDVFVLPYFLAPGIHLRRDLPRIMEELGRIHTGVRIAASDALDGHPALLQILLDRAAEALAAAGRNASAEEKL